MFGSFDWNTDVVPQIIAFTSNGLVRGTLIAVCALFVASTATYLLMKAFGGQR